MPVSRDDVARQFMALALRYGYRRTTLDDVVKALHISKKTVYEHFSCKEDLLRYAVELSASEQRRGVEARLTATSALERALETVEIALGDVRRAVEASPPTDVWASSEITAEVNDRVFAPMVRDLVAAGVAGDEFSVPDVDFTTACCMAAGMEAVRIIRDDPSHRPEAAALDAVRRLLTGADEGVEGTSAGTRGAAGRSGDARPAGPTAG